MGAPPIAMIGKNSWGHHGREGPDRISFWYAQGLADDTNGWLWYHIQTIFQAFNPFNFFNVIFWLVRKPRSQASTFVRFLFSGCAAALPWPFGLLMVVLPMACRIVLSVVPFHCAHFSRVSFPPSNTNANAISGKWTLFVACRFRAVYECWRYRIPNPCSLNVTVRHGAWAMGNQILQELSQSQNVSAALGGVWGSSTEAPDLSILRVFFGARQRCQGHWRTTCNDLLSTDFPGPPACAVRGFCFGAESPGLLPALTIQDPLQAESSKSSARIWRDEALYFTQWMRQCDLASFMSRVHLWC